MTRSIVCAVDESPVSRDAAVWASNVVARPGDTLHFIAIAPPARAVLTPAPPMATAAAVAALSANWDQQRKAEEEACRHRLYDLLHSLPEDMKRSVDIHRHVLPAAGGASGVAESVVAFVKEQGAELVVVGSRGMGAARSTLMSLIGLGSVSSYLVHNLHCPVAVYRGRADDTAAKAKRKVLVSLDDSEASRHALEWAVGNVLGPTDELHLVCVALPIPFPVSPAEPYTSPPLAPDEWQASYGGSLQHTEATLRAAEEHTGSALKIVAEDAAASEVLEADEYDAATHDSNHYARETVTAAVDRAVAKVERERIFFKALPPEGGASDVGQSVAHYSKANGVDLVVLGARGMGSFKRAMLSFVGLGSVSDYVVSHVEVPVIVVK